MCVCDVVFPGRFLISILYVCFMFNEHDLDTSGYTLLST